MRSISEIIHNDKTVQAILDEAHKNGERAYLRWADLNNADLSGANLRWADLSGADLHGADLNNADLRWANLIKADLHGAYLHGAYLHGADLHGANLSGANLSGANLSGANLSGANLNNADLSGAYLFGADLYAAKGIYSFGPIGEHGRIGYAILHKDGTIFKLGCCWANLADTRKAIVKDYGKNSLYEKQVILAAKILEAQ